MVLSTTKIREETFIYLSMSTVIDINAIDISEVIN